jgi:hypothetical protein
MTQTYGTPAELILGTNINGRVPEADQRRQRSEVDEILNRLRTQPGVILADEVGMGKTYVALAIAYSVAIRSHRGPVIVMVPANLVDKWVQDLKTFCELYLDNRSAIERDQSSRNELIDASAVRYGIARHSNELLKLLDDPSRERCHLIFLAHGAMGRQQTDTWIRLAVIAEALRRHGRGTGRLVDVKNQIHRFIGRLLSGIGKEREQELGDALWRKLIRTDPGSWKDIYNAALKEGRAPLSDDPVPKAVVRALNRVDLKQLAETLKALPIRVQGGDERLRERLRSAQKALTEVEKALWKDLLAQARWRSPLLIMDEAHHLKNPGTLLARQLQSPLMEQDLRTGDGAMANAFDRMLFLTATPFQLGHHELVSVLRRFGDVRWSESELGPREHFDRRLDDLSNRLTESQRAAIALRQSWTALRPEDYESGDGGWWDRLLLSPRENLTSHQRAVVDAFRKATLAGEAAEESLRPWILRHNKGAQWTGTQIQRRKRLDGASIAGNPENTGLLIPFEQLLPFFLAARSAVNPGQDVLGEALCSSFEAFRFTRQSAVDDKDEQELAGQIRTDLSHSAWYLNEFDQALQRCAGSSHPKVSSTVKRVVDLWETGEKVLVFGFYRRTCRALRIHISQEIERRIMEAANRRLQKGGNKSVDIDNFLERIQRRYFDDADSPGRRAVDAALSDILARREAAIEKAGFTVEDREKAMDVMRRFLRVSTTLVRCFPIEDADSIKPVDAIAQTLDHPDGSNVTWRQKFEGFIQFLTDQCSIEERAVYLEAAMRTQTGGIRVDDDERDDEDPDASKITLANVQVATGETKRDKRSRLMRAFNTPFFPDILVCSEVMGEGVDLQRFCRHVIHHDLDWNPSQIEQRTGRIDRLGCKAEGRQPIVVYVPYLAGTADERQYKVMSDRERWFRVVMGQDEVARLITPESTTAIPLPDPISQELSFKLGLQNERPHSRR